MLRHPHVKSTETSQNKTLQEQTLKHGTSAENLFESLYDNFLLRDLFAKIVPGAIVLIASLYETPMAMIIIDQTGKAGLPAALLLAGIAWIVGIAVQGFGTSINLIKHHPSPDFDNDNIRYNTRSHFNSIAKPFDIKQVERFAIIKEAAGNAAMAISIGITIATLRGVPQIFLPDQPIFILIAHFCLMSCLPIIVAISLFEVNRKHVKKQYKYMLNILEHSK
ncbi:MAG: hypothetical protein PHU06_10630 [Gallionella sp.]|nr:hypothetical protein [Gallionella sp.]MDD4959534.1 hypothetical protein [Gallionella sp.]